MRNLIFGQLIVQKWKNKWKKVFYFDQMIAFKQKQ